MPRTSISKAKPKVADPILDLSSMRRALALAEGGYSAPNPHVGCVVCRDGVVVGEGASEPAGGAHAEVLALRDAGFLAQGATVYVTLEPCNHQGRTGPCTAALVSAGVSRVVYAVSDPNREASGGAKVLREAGIEVSAGLCADEAEKVHEQFLFAFRHSRPLVAVKAAMTLDGRVNWPDGRSKWITSRESREKARLLRATYGAVLVGCGTVVADDPALTSRHPDVFNEPLRVVLDPNARLIGDERVFHGPGSYLWLVRTATLEGQTSQAQWEIKDILQTLWERGCTGVMVEGGPGTWAPFLSSGLVDRVELFVAPVIFGAGSVWANVSGGWPPEGHRFSMVSSERIGDDVWLRYRRG